MKFRLTHVLHEVGASSHMQQLRFCQWSQQVAGVEARSRNRFLWLLSLESGGCAPKASGCPQSKWVSPKQVGAPRAGAVCTEAPSQLQMLQKQLRNMKEARERGRTPQWAGPSAVPAVSSKHCTRLQTLEQLRPSYNLRTRHIAPAPANTRTQT